MDTTGATGNVIFDIAVKYIYFWFKYDARKHYGKKYIKQKWITELYI